MSTSIRTELDVTAPARTGPLLTLAQLETMFTVEVDVDVHLLLKVRRQFKGLVAALLCVGLHWGLHLSPDSLDSRESKELKRVVFSFRGVINFGHIFCFFILSFCHLNTVTNIRY